MIDKFKIELTETNKIIPYENNTKIHPDAQIKLIADSIEKFNFDQPIVVDEDFIVIKGHGRLLAAQHLKLDKVPVIIRTDLTEAQKIASRIADNKSNESDWDFPLLNIELEELKDLDFDYDFGFTDDEILTPDKDGLTEDDYIPEVAEPICQTGDLWKLGEHKILCGDATKKEDVERLMDGEKADMVFTDPPYGVSVNQGTIKDLKARNRRTDGKVVLNDDLTGGKLKEFLLEAFKNIYENIKSGGVLYVCHAESMGMDIIFRTAFVEAGFKSSEIIIWVKDVFAFGRQDYHWRHEPIIYGWKEGSAHYFIKDRTQDTCWNIDRPKKSEYHPTTKPIELCSKAITNSSRKNEICLDLFAGSGSTLIACEKTNRKCYGMEIDPHYCDVIIARWEEYTGNKAVKI